jgi:hypothetical protein
LLAALLVEVDAMVQEVCQVMVTVKITTMKLLPNTVKYRNRDLVIGITHYDTSPDHKAIVSNDFKTGEPVASITRNFPDQLASDEVAIDTNNLGDTIEEILVAADIIGQEILRYIPSGFCNYPVHKLLV